MPLVLAVDDHRDTCNAMARLVRLAGAEAACAYGGQEAVAFVRGRVPAAVVLDLAMPDIDGFETLRRMRAVSGFAGVPVIVCSAWAGADDVRPRLRALGAVDFCEKGAMSPETFTATLRRHVQLPEA